MRSPATQGEKMNTAHCRLIWQTSHTYFCFSGMRVWRFAPSMSGGVCPELVEGLLVTSFENWVAVEFDVFDSGSRGVDLAVGSEGWLMDYKIKGKS